MSHNLRFAKKYIVDWFPNLCKIIKEEQEMCVMGDQKRERKFYSNYLSKLSSEKIAIICLTELMKEILKLTIKVQQDSGDHKIIDLHPCMISKNLFE